MTGFDQLHPSLQHHVVNTLGWRSLRPLQDAAVEPVMKGHHALFLAPTAGGKTEAAAFPVFSRMASEQWKPLSVLYLAPLRALLNNLQPRLELYGSFVGRRAGLWHGDTSQGERTRMIVDPPDLMLTTPESLEAMLISRRVNERWMFEHLQMVVIDEVHAFAAADRGWHLLAVLERMTKLAGRELPRIGLSATVGNPHELLAWMCGTGSLESQVVNPAAEALAEPEVTLDYVGSLDNAATVISRMHHGEKRLVFVDSRRRVEELSATLRGLGVTTFVSHGSLGRDERRRSETAFAEASDCVIVATSTLELGIDVGDLDRVIQIDSPPTVAGFLQRIGRTGRRRGSSRNALFLTTSPDALLQAAGLLRLWATGFVEPAEPPPLPAHLIAQQVLALTLQEAARGLGRYTWTEWLGEPPVLGQAVIDQYAEPLVQHLLASGWLHDDEGLLSPGAVAESTIGRRNFLELTSVFVADPLVSVRHGRTDIGSVPDIAISAAYSNDGPPMLLLAGRSWLIKQVDWKRRVATVEPVDSAAKVRFPGSARALSYELCQAMAGVLAGESLDPVVLTQRAQSALSDVRDGLLNARPGRTLLVPSTNGQRWYTFAGLRANVELAARLRHARSQVVQKDNLYITVDDGVDAADLRAAVLNETDRTEMERLVEAVSGSLKLERALPDSLIADVMISRMRDPVAVGHIASAPIDTSAQEPGRR